MLTSFMDGPLWSKGGRHYTGESLVDRSTDNTDRLRKRERGEWLVLSLSQLSPSSIAPQTHPILRTTKLPDLSDTFEISTARLSLNPVICVEYG